MRFRHLLVLTFPFFLFGCFKTREEIAREKEDQEVRSTLQQNVVEYNQSMEQLRGDMAALKGRVDEMEHARKKDMSGFASAQEGKEKALAQSIEDLKTRLASLQEAQNALFEEVKKMREDSIAPAPTRAAIPSKKKGNRGAPPASFDAAVAAYKARDYAAASAGLRGYLDANPKGKHALDAHYYLGDSLFKQKEFEQAVVEFGTVHEKAPTTFYGRRSALRLAQSFKAMGKTKDARAFAQLLVQESPDSEEAKTARKMFK
jgi:TolA-binding protein